MLGDLGMETRKGGPKALNLKNSSQQRNLFNHIVYSILNLMIQKTLTGLETLTGEDSLRRIAPKDKLAEGAAPWSPASKTATSA